MELSRDKIKEIINDDWLLMDDCEGNKNCDVVKEMARIALASLEAEPVAWLLSGGGAKNNVSFDSGNAYADQLREVTPLYTAPPAPVSVPAAMEIDDDFDSAFEHGKAVGWNAYRAAMLQAEPVSNSDELPLDYLQGHKDGLEWAAQLAEANHPQTGDWLYDDPIDLAMAIRKGPDMPTVQAGNSPVTPDGLSTVCAEAYQVVGVMADALGVFGDAAVQKVLDNLSQQKLVHRDVLPFSLPVTPDGWISCSEQMPDDGQHVIILCDGAFVLYAQYRDGEFFDVVRNGEEFFETQSRNVTDWMPLPEPPQEAK